MLYTKSLFAIASAVLLTGVQAAFNATSNSNIVYYWGQNSASATGDMSLWQKRLGHYCDTEDADIFVVSFLHQFGQGRSTAFDLANSSRDCKGLIPGTQLMDCPQMEEDIKYCQSKDKKIILSLGGATPAYGVDTIKEGEELADELWETFAGGMNKTITRPFGNATVDGFDLDIENGAKAGYTAFVNKMRKNYETDPSKSYYVAAAPQCPFPDYFVGDTLNDSWFDFVMIQFYNNYCNVVNKPTFNYDIWDSWAKTRSINKNVRLFVGVPGSPSAAGRGYVPYKQLVETIKPLQSLESFGGVMVWDVSQAYGNTQDVLPNYAQGVTRLVKGGNDISPIEFAPTNSVLSSSNPTSSAVLSVSSTDSAASSASTTNGATASITLSSTTTPSSNSGSSVSVSDSSSTENYEMSTSTLNSLTGTELLTSTTIPATSTCTSLSISTGYSTTNVVSTTMAPNSAFSGEYTESAITIQTIIPYTTTVAVCGNNSTSSGNASSTTEPKNSTVLPSTNATTFPQEGESCSIEGSLKCSGPASFAQCVYGKYTIRNCAAATVCIDDYGTTPPSIYCGFS